MKKAHSWETPRSRGLERAISSSAAARASETRSEAAVAASDTAPDGVADSSASRRTRSEAADLASARCSDAAVLASATRSLARSRLVISRASLADLGWVGRGSQ